MSDLRVSIYQPQYFPRLHYVARALDSDVFVLMESAQYTKKLSHPGGKAQPSYQADTPIKLSDGRHMLTVPVQRKPSYQPINKKAVDYSQDWPERHLSSLYHGYQATPRYADLVGDLERVLAHEYETLADLNRATILWSLARVLDLPLDVDSLRTPCFNAALAASDTPGRLQRVVPDTELTTSRPEGRQQGAEWTAAICEELGATEYLHGGTAQYGYMEAAPYKQRGIRTVCQEWTCAPYPQAHAKSTDFIPNLSVLDLLCNVDTASAQEVLASDR